MLKNVIDSKGMDYMELYLKAQAEYGLDITYKGFMSLLSNRSTWKLIYAWAIADVLKVRIDYVFEVIHIDVEKAKKAKMEWKDKYEKKG
jgi:hypothetical protein